MSTRLLVSIATILFVLTVVTGFFGQNGRFIPYDSPSVFWAAMIAAAVVAVTLAMYFHRRGWL